MSDMALDLSDDAKLLITILACAGAYMGGTYAGVNDMSLRQVFEGAVAGAVAAPASAALLFAGMCLAETGYHKTWQTLERTYDRMAGLFSGLRPQP